MKIERTKKINFILKFPKNHRKKIDNKANQSLKVDLFVLSLF